MKRREVRSFTATALTLMLILQPWLLRGSADAKTDCGPVTNKSNDLAASTAAIGTNPAGTGAHAIALQLARAGSKTTSIAGKVQPYNGPNAWMPLLQSGELEMGIMNILDFYMACHRNRQLRKGLSPAFVWFQGGCFLSRLELSSAISRTSNRFADLKGKRIAWDYRRACNKPNVARCHDGDRRREAGRR